MTGGMLLPILDGRGVGTCLGRVTSVYKVRGQLAARITHRATTAIMFLTGRIDVRGITGVLKRSGVHVARRCTGMLSASVLHSVKGIREGFSGERV